MDGYTLINKMRKMRRKHPLTATEQALYNELVAICNEVEWSDVFTCSNFELCNSLSISENTLKDSRNRLIQVGLVYYQSGKSKRQFSKYSFTKNLSTTSKFDTKGATNGATDSGTNKPETTSKFEDYYKQTKLKEDINKGLAQEGDLTKIEIGNTIEFVDRVKQVKLSTEEILNYWAAFNLNEAEKVYYTREKKIQHFRNWLKNQKNGNSAITTGNKSHSNNGSAAGAILLLNKVKQQFNQ